MQLKRRQYLDDVVCGGRYSGLVTSNGEVWLCGNIKPAKKEEEEEKQAQVVADLSDEDEFGKKGGKKKKKNKAKERRD